MSPSTSLAVLVGCGDGSAVAFGLTARVYAGASGPGEILAGARSTARIGFKEVPGWLPDGLECAGPYL
jgi:hypothetical protein